ncbi:MAG: DUF4410 domain-containing protein [Phycisphaerae bacterium]
MNKYARCVILLPMFFLYGCYSINNSRLHVLDQKLSYENKKNVGLVYKDHNLKLDQIDAIALQPIDVNLGSMKKVDSKLEDQAKKFASDLEVDLTAAIPQKTLFSVISAGEVVPETLRVANLSIVVTEFYPGNGAMRYIIGCGAGSTKIQMESKLTSKQDELLMALGSRKDHNGNPTLGLNVSSVSNDYTDREIRKQFVEMMTKLLRGEELKNKKVKKSKK